ncbi:two-component system sensor histidine kinase CpxA [Rodentibacter trehalosifermentans]|uniref:histidine kinase n=1 Tax=Rodentibacter trehalosifermentans TaxID=1908263 RepID=A0A1V3J0D2_9PAST|nr:envelope stress sensor histidine kinase CpxA [Rodentibacter trehalosifermentans]OOF48325.1 two-component system sensor histidine kinase CpxA [Rodentibacter trehalosifermentans]
MQYQSKFSLNQLTIRTFTVFWVGFFAMMALVVTLPYLDSTIYSSLQENEITHYQKKIAESIRNNKIKSLAAKVPILPIDKSDNARPILFDPNKKEILGAFNEEKNYVYRFIDNANEFSHPMKKNFKDIQIAGPFQIYLDDFSEPFSLFFISRVNPYQEILRYMIDYPIVLFLLTVFITSPLLWWFTHTIVKPISRLQKAANSVALGNFEVDSQLTKHGPLELRQVGQSFNRMTKSINDLLSNHQNLLSSISHELKTPLTRLQLATALIRHQIGDNLALKRIEKEIERMDKMINELLLISRQQMNSQTERNIFPAENIWHDVIQDALFEAEQQRIEFEQYINLPNNGMPILLNGNIKLLQSAVENIIRNALKYTKDKIKLTIFIQEEEEEEFVRIRIDDNGSGVSPTEFEKIFHPFYRVDEARTRTTGGTGLGLAIVSNVVKEHQGKVWVEKSEFGGLAVTIALPLWLNK